MTEVEILDSETNEVILTVIVENEHNLWALMGYSDRLKFRFFPMVEA